MKKRFQITVDDITKISNRIIISGKSNAPTYAGEIAGLTVTAVITEPLFPDRAFLNVVKGDINKIKIGQTLYGE